MFNVTSLRYRYAQFFILFLLCSLLYMMARSIGTGIMKDPQNIYQKDFLIGQSNLLRLKMGDRVFPVVLTGKDGWMNFTGEENIDDFQNVHAFKNKKQFARQITVLNEYLKSQGITLLIVAAPNKASIYPDRFPEEIKPLSPQSKLDSLISYFESNDLPLLLDLRPDLRMARQERDVYYKTDSHWNGYGAFVAYTTILNALAESYPELKPYDAADLRLVTTAPAVRDIPYTMRINSITEASSFYTLDQPLVQTTRPGGHLDYDQLSWIEGSTLPTLLMFHDSFGITFLDDYLSMNFGQSHFFQIQSMSRYLTKETIQQIKPDVVIIEIVERNLRLLPEDLPAFLLE